MAGRMDTNAMLTELAGEVTMVLETIRNASAAGGELLNTPPQPGKWSVAQIVEHLNTYNRYYIPRMQKALGMARKGNGTFSPGWLGNYFTKSMYSEVKTANKVVNKMGAMKGHIPAEKLDAPEVMAEFLAAQRELLQLLKDMEGKDLASVKIPITISRFIKIKLGDAARFLVAHQVRHLLQVSNTVKPTGTMSLSQDM